MAFGLALAVLTSTISAAPIHAGPEGVVADHDTLYRLLNRPGGAYATTFSAKSECAYRHTYRKAIARRTWIDRYSVIDFADLDVARLRIENRAPEPAMMIIVPLRQGAGEVLHSLKLIDGTGDMHRQFIELYGGECGEAHCHASRGDREAYFTVAGETAAADAEAVAAAIRALTAHCAPAGGV